MVRNCDKIIILSYIGEFVLFSTILNRTIPGIVLSEIVLSGDPLYHYKIWMRGSSYLKNKIMINEKLHSNGIPSSFHLDFF